MPNFLKDSAYLTYLDQIEQINDMPKGLLSRVMRAESGGKPGLTSKAGAVGLFQFLPGTAKHIGVDPHDPIEAAGGAAIYLKRMHNQFGDWGKAVAAYNAGPGNIGKGRYPKETRNYVAKVFGKTPPSRIAPAPEMPLPEIPTIEASGAADAGALPTLAPSGKVSSLGWTPSLLPALGGEPTARGPVTEDIEQAQAVEGRHRQKHAPFADIGPHFKEGLLKGAASMLDFYTQAGQGAWAPMPGTQSLPLAPVEDALREKGFIKDLEPTDPAQEAATQAGHLLGSLVTGVDPISVGRGAAKGGAALGKHLLEEVGTKAAGSPGMQRGIFVPVTAKQAAKAEDLVAKGATREEIWKKHLMYKGLDGKWRTEISDKEARLRPEGWQPGSGGGKHTEFGGASPEMILEHPELYKAQPSIATKPSVSAKYGRGMEESGLYSPEGRAIEAYSETPEGMKSNLLHELTHDIQTEHEWAVGGSPESAGYAPEIRKAHHEATGEYLALRKSIGKRTPTPAESNQLDALMSRIKTLGDAGLKSTYEQYRLLAGEAEARNVQTRMDWTPEQRKAIPPWQSLDVPESELIVRRGGGVQAAIENPPTRPKEVTPAMRETRAKEQGYLPVTLYHGTVHKPGERGMGIEAFDPKRAGKRTDTGWYGEGVYTTADPELASDYAKVNNPYSKNLGATVYPVKSRIKNPLVYTKVEGGYPQAYEARAVEDAKTLRTLNAMKGWTPKELELINGRGGGINLESITARVGPKRMREVLKANGHDGVVVNLHDPKYPENSQPYHEVVAFDPNQIRSVHADFEPTAQQKPLIGATSRYSKERGAVGELKSIPEEEWNRRAVMRIEEPGIPRGEATKPHGLYTTPAVHATASPHLDLGGDASWWLRNDKNPLDVSGELWAKSTTRRTPGGGPVPASAGIKALFKLWGPERSAALLNMRKGEAAASLNKSFPEVDWSRYHDSWEMGEGVAGILARRKGHDAIIDNDAVMPEFSEHVFLSDRALSKVEPHEIPDFARKPPLGAQGPFKGERGAVGTLTPPTPPARPASRQLELSTTVLERNKVRRDIERLSSQTAVLSNSQVRRLSEMNNELAALDTTIESLGGRRARPAIEQLAALNSAPNVREIARRGRQSWAESERLAIAARSEALPELSRITGETPKDIESVMRRNIGEAYNAEHVVNAANRLKTQWAEDHAFYKNMVAKMEEGTFADIDILAAHERIVGTTALQAQYSGVAAEAGRALQIFNKMKREGIYDINERVQAALSQHHGEGADLLKAKIVALAKLDAADAARGIQDTRQIFEANNWNRFHEALYNSVLSGIDTQVANLTGNWGVQLFEDVVRFSAAMKPWRKDVTMREAMAHFNGWFGGTVDALRAFGHVMRTEEAYGPFVGEGFKGKAFKGFKGRLGKILPYPRAIRLATTTMRSTDAAFKALSYAKVKRALATRESLKTGRPLTHFMDETTPEGKQIAKESVKESHRRTFTDPPGKWVQKVEGLQNVHPLMRLPMLFVRTPAKLMGMPLKNSILGRLFSDVRATLAKGGAEAQLQKERMSLGTGIAGLAFLMAQNDLIIGAAPDDPKLRDLFIKSGRVPYSFNLKKLGWGEGYLPFARAEPWATYLGSMANLSQYLREKPLEKDNERDVMDYGIALMGGITENLGDKTFMRSITDFTEAWSEPKRFLERYLANLLSPLVPTMVARIAKADDPYLREANNIMDRLRLRIPGQRQQLPRKVHGTGEFMEERGTWMEKMTSPFIPSAFRDDPLVEELLRLKLGVGVAERTKSKTIFGKQYNVNLDPKTYELLATTRGKVLRGLLTNVINTEGYKRKPDYERAALMDDILHKAKQEIGAALGKGLERDILKLLIEQNPDILDIKMPGRPPGPTP